MTTWAWIICVCGTGVFLLLSWIAINKFARTADLSGDGVAITQARVDVIKTFIQVFGLMALVIAAYNTWSESLATKEQLKAINVQVEQTEKRLITSRFSMAVEQLGNNSVQTRIGSIYTLEQIAMDNPSDYHKIVFEVLASYVRSNDRDFQKDNFSPDELPATPIDIQTAITAIGRRDVEWEDRNVPAFTIDLSNADLRCANLVDANLQSADLSEADLRYADMSGADLQFATINDADLRFADLRYSNLHSAYLVSSNLHDAYLVDAILCNANLSNSDLTDAHLQDADLSNTLLFCADLRYADLNRCDFSETALVNAILYDVDFSLVEEGMTLNDFTCAFVSNTTQPPYYLQAEWNGHLEELLRHDDWPSYWPKERVSKGCATPESHSEKYWPGF